MTANMAESWHIRRYNDPSGWEGGPYTWQQLLDFQRERRLGPLDPVWHPSMADWAPANTVTGLFPETAPAPATPAPQPAVTPTPTPHAPAAVTPQPAPAPAQPPRKRRGCLIAIVVLLVLALIAGTGFGVWWFWLRDGGDSLGDGPRLGAAETKLPDDASLVATAEWGEVPANQVCVLMAEGSTRKDAKKVADALGGTVVGEVAYVSVFQIEYPGTTEADLASAISTAEGIEGVEGAFPNQQNHLDAEIWGTRVDPYNDPLYGGGAGAGYQAIGVAKAWTYIKGAGTDLSSVKVGVVDDGLYMPGDGAENEFEGGKTKIEFPDPAAGENANPEVWDDGTTNPAGSHGTGVSTIIGADPDNGGPTGVAGPLGNKLTISMINVYGGQYGNTTSTPDPNDPTKFVSSSGKTWSLGSLVALTKQVEAGAKVINCSWGNSDAHPNIVAAYTKFFTKMSQDHPDVVFVCSGGNGGTVMNGSKRIPSGLKLPNMITVGALNADGTTADYADKASADYEITLGAPGTQAVVGMKPGGGPEQQDGSSFAAPQVAAAAAILKSLNPKLSAGEIKQILTETARPGVPNTSGAADAESKLVNKNEMGAGILAVDEAVLRVINDLRKGKGLDPLTPEMLEKMGVVDAVAVTGEPGEYTVRGIVEAAGEKGVNLKIEVFGENSAIGGKTEQSLSGAGEIEWSVTLPKDKGSIKVTRLDNGAASVIDIEQFDLSGTWTGTYTLTNVVIEDEEAAKEEGCDLALVQGLLNKPLPATLVCTVNENGQGSGTFTVDASKISDDAESEPVPVTISQSGSRVTVTFQEGGVSPMDATVARSGSSLVMNGTIGGGGSGFSYTVTISLSKPDTP